MSKTLVNKYTKSDILLDFLPPLIFFLLRIFCRNFRSVLFAKKIKCRTPVSPSSLLCMCSCVRACVFLSLYTPRLFPQPTPFRHVILRRIIRKVNSMRKLSSRLSVNSDGFCKEKRNTCLVQWISRAEGGRHTE